MNTETNLQKLAYAVSLTDYRLVAGVSHCWIMEKIPSPLDPLLGEIEKAIENELYFAALIMTLALPDICASLAHGRTEPSLYREWCDNCLGGYFGFVTGKDLYSMRCGVLHQGRFGDLKHSIGRVIFLLPGHFKMVDCQINDAYIYSVDVFCRNFIAAVQDWFDKHKEDKQVRANLPLLMQYRENGLAPYITGYPILA